jgi:hypothetical protein
MGEVLVQSVPLTPSASTQDISASTQPELWSLSSTILSVVGHGLN